MPVSTEALILSVLFLLPGYAVQRLTRSFSAAPHRASTTFDSVLTSLGVTIGIMAFLSLLAAIIAGVVYLFHRSWLSDLELSLLINDGFKAYLQKYPWTTVFAIGAGSLSTLAIASWWGLNDPSGGWLERRQTAAGVAADDMWVMAFEKDRLEAGFESVHLSIKLRDSGDTIRGRLRGISLKHDDDNPRDIYLQQVSYLPRGEAPIYYKAPEAAGTAAIVSSSQVESILAIYPGKRDELP